MYAFNTFITFIDIILFLRNKLSSFFPSPSPYFSFLSPLLSLSSHFPLSLSLFPFSLSSLTPLSSPLPLSPLSLLSHFPLSFLNFSSPSFPSFPSHSPINIFLSPQIKTGGVNLCVIDDCGDCDVPLLEVSLSHLSLKQVSSSLPGREVAGGEKA